MRVSIKPGIAQGQVSAPPSKSMAHRLLICAGMSRGKSVIHGMSHCEDALATMDCLRALGAECTLDGDTVTVVGCDVCHTKPLGELCCRESGSTLRFFLPLALLSGNTTTMYGSAYLMQRPMGVYEELCRIHGLEYQQKGQRIQVKGPLSAGEYTVAGNISSQFISGLLFALPLCNGESKIKMIPPIESRSYINMTLSALHEFGIRADWIDDCTLNIHGNQQYRSCETTVEGDWSNAAFLDALGCLGGDVTVTGLCADTLQGDRVYREYFKQLCSGIPTLHIGDCPDLGPILFALAAAKNGATFTGTARLKIKESDRAAVMAQELKKMGADLAVDEDRVIVSATALHEPIEPLNGHNDHRIVMSLAVLLTLVGGEIYDAQAVEKSFPDFFDRITALGLEVQKQ